VLLEVVIFPEPGAAEAGAWPELEVHRILVLLGMRRLLKGGSAFVAYKRAQLSVDHTRVP
jgi:hypothetical protein